MKLMTASIMKQILHKRRTDEPVANQQKYKEDIGSLQYAATIFRPDISFASRKLAIYVENLSLIHVARVKRIVQYLHGMTKIYLC